MFFVWTEFCYLLICCTALVAAAAAAAAAIIVTFNVLISINRYLNSNGKLELYCTAECLFSAEYHSGHLALRDRWEENADLLGDSILNCFGFLPHIFSHGSYLSPIGSKAVLKSRSQTVTRDELFSLEDSLPQASFVAALNLKYVSVKQGVDVTANQDEIGTDETFQLEYDWSARRWALRTTQVSYRPNRCAPASSNRLHYSIEISRIAIGVYQTVPASKPLATVDALMLYSKWYGMATVRSHSGPTMENS